MTTLTEYGVLAKIGVNDAGLGVMLNMLHHDADAQPAGEERIGFPVHVLLRTLLEDCASVAEARDLVGSLSFSASSAVTVVDRGGDAASLETFPEGVGEVKPEAGLLVRTNHFVSAEGEPGCQGGVNDDNSWVRRDHLVDTLTATPPAYAADVQAAMTHHDPAGPICRHAFDPDDPDLVDTATLATVTLDVERGELSVLRGGPCQDVTSLGCPDDWPMIRRGDVLALVQAGGQGSRMDVLTRERAKPVLPYGGTHRLIDFTLSSLANSGLVDVWVSVEYQVASLDDYLSGGRPWSLDRNRGGFRRMVPQTGSGPASEDAFAHGNADLLLRMSRDLIHFGAPTVLVSSADHVFAADLAPTLERHLESGADATVMTSEVTKREASSNVVVLTGRGADGATGRPGWR